MTLREALSDPIVLKAVDALTLELDLSELDDPDHEEYDPFVSNRRVFRDAKPGDYVAAIYAVAKFDAARFDGLDLKKDVTAAAVATLLEGV